MPARHLILGRKGEDVSVHYLKRKGYSIVARNWRAKSLELDIVARDGDTLVFVEVKTRSAATLGDPWDSVGRAKQNRLSRAAAAFLSEKDLWDSPCRFDVLALVRDADGAISIEHLENAFSFASRNGSSWQPF